MKQIPQQDIQKYINIINGGNPNPLSISPFNISLRVVLEYLRTPTFDEVVKVWYEKQGLSVRKSDEYIEIYSEFSKTSYFKIYYQSFNNRVWLNPNYHAITAEQFELLNLTIRYL